MLTFQDLILTLHAFWSKKGCLIWQPHNQVVGAGTLNPATFLRVLGPEPWNVAYAEPSVRPDDGRFGENPNRMYTHTQYQVILKPAPENSQEIYLESLAAIGIDRAHHDIRFVEDNWESPALGAWGLGWEVWLDGLEITQYTYFQQAGGFDLKPVSLELTYGLERIAMYLQNVRSVWDLQYDAYRTYGDVMKDTEVERCEYAFHDADVEVLNETFANAELECKRALDKGLVAPAHDYVLNMSNTFNLLDTRGAVGVTERARFFGRMRDLARQVAVKYVEQREERGHPWLLKPQPMVVAPPRSAHQTLSVPLRAIETPAPLLFEIGVEELPARDVPVAQAQLGKLLTAALDDARIEHGAVELFATPRRIAALVADVAPRQRSLDEWVKGPGAKAAFDAAGKPTPAAIGFAKRFGLEPSALVVKADEKGGSYVYAARHEDGRPAVFVLCDALPKVVASIAFEKSMRWNASNIAFSRPISWFTALLDDQVIAFEYAGVTSGRSSLGPRSAGSPVFDIAKASDYPERLREQGILGNIEARKAEIQRQIDLIAASVGGRIKPDAGLMEEVANLVEQPTAVLGHFDPDSLRIPAPVLTTVMRKHQRYFSILDAASGALLPHFIAVRNGGEDFIDEVRAGNEGVLRARFADAGYFFKADTRKPLAEYLPRLGTLTFQAKLGSMLDKTGRLEALSLKLAEQLGASEADAAIARSAAGLCKADLATSMVIDFTSLQGVMGREYLLREGGDPAVAQAIYEHYLPQGAGDPAPASEAGLIVGLADKLDSLAGLFAVGLAPKGSSDPFALRRAAIGIAQNLVATRRSFSLRDGLAAAASLLPVKASSEALAAAHAFVVERQRANLLEAGFRFDVIDAVLAEQGDDPWKARQAIEQLNALVASADWPAILAATSRCARIVKSAPASSAAAGQDDDPASRALAHALISTPEPTDIPSLVAGLSALAPAINTFFEKVMVMAEDPDLRAARLALVSRVAGLSKGLMDFSRLEGF